MNPDDELMWTSWGSRMGNITFGPPSTPTIGPGINGPVVTLTEEQKEQFKKASAVKFDEGKLDWTLLPMDSLEDVVKVLALGAKKYNEQGDGPDTWNWTKGSGLGKWRLLKSLFRHLTSYMRGEIYDPESGVNHLAHVVCNCLFILHYHKNPDKFGKMDN
jgi:hypothetical protein